MRFGPFFRRRVVVVAAVLAATAVLFVLLLHAPFVRAAALRYALAVVQERYDLDLKASRLDYNLAALRIGLADLRVAASHSRDDPFVLADYVSVTLPWRIVIGDVALEEIHAANARILVRTREDGTTNLPRASETPTGEPAPLRVQLIDIPQLAIDIRNEQAAVFFWMPSIAARLTPETGSVRFGAPAQLYTEKQLTRISQLEGTAAFDGRTLRVANLQIRTNEGSARVDGTATLIAREPSVDLRVQGSIDTTQLTRWFIANGELPRGDVAFEAEASGAFDSVETQLTMSSARLAWQDLAATDLTARARVTSEAAELDELRFGFGGGHVVASGTVPFDAEGSRRVSASLIGVDATAAARASARDIAVAPSGILSGQLDAAGRGSDLTQWDANARLSVGSGRNSPGRLAIGGNATLALSGGEWRLDSRPLVGGVAPLTIALRGNLENAISGTVHLDETDVPSLVRVLRATGITTAQDVVERGSLEADVTLGGRISAPTIEGRATVRNASASQIEAELLQADFAGQPLESRLDFHLTAPDAAVAGQALREIQVAGRLTNTSPSANSSPVLSLDELSARQPDGPGVIRASGTYDVRTEEFTATIDGTQWTLTPTPDRPAVGSIDLRFTGEGTVEQPRGTGTLIVHDAAWADMALGPLDASVELEGQAARITAQAPQFATTATARIAIAEPYQTTFEINTKELDLSRVVGYVEIPAALAGRTTFSLHGEAPLQAWRSGAATLEVAALDARVGDLPVHLPVPARVRYEEERAHVDRLDVSAGEMTISASGSLPVFEAAPDDPAVLVSVAGSVDEVVRAATAAGVFAPVGGSAESRAEGQNPPFVTGGEGPVALLARVTGAVQRPVVAADLEVGPGSVALQDLPRITGVRLKAHAENGWVELLDGAAAYEGTDVAVTGKAPLSLLTGQPGPTGDAALHARLTNLTPAAFAAFVEPGTLDELGGSIDATLDVATPTLELADLTGELRIDRFDVRAADLPVTQRVPTRIVARDGFARIAAWEWTGQGATLNVAGQVRLEDRQAAILVNGGVDLRLLTPFVRSTGLATAGRLEPRLSITGSLDDPRIDGDLLVSDGELRLVDPRVIVSDLTVRTVLTRTTARVTELTGTVNGGALTGGGTVEYSPERGLEAQLSTEIHGMAMDYPPGLRSEVDSSLQLKTTAAPAGTNRGTLSGTITVLRGTYRQPLAVLTGLLAGLRTQRLSATPESSASLDALSLDVRLVTDEDIYVDNNYGRFQLGADLRLIGTAGAPGLSGRAEIREGGRLFVGRNVYAVSSGAIDFANPAAIEPRLNIEATTRAGGEDIQVTITGLAESPMVDLRSTSNPDLGQAEIASLLLTGRRFEDLDPSDAAFVSTQVLGNFSAEVLGFASRAVGLDTLRLGGVDNPALRRDTTTVATEVDPTTRVTFGKSIGPDVDVTFSQSLRDSDAQTWIVDYAPARGLELRLVSNDDDLLSYGFRHDVAFGPGGRPAQTRAAAPLQQAGRVATIDVSGELALPEMQVRSALRLRQGNRFDFVAWQDDRDRLEGLYRASGYLTARVTARRMENASGVALSYVIAAGPQTRITATGIDLDGDLKSRLETAWSQSVFDQFLIDEATQVVREYLARRGYLQPTVAARVRDEGGTKTLELTVDRGLQTARTTVRVDGVTDALAADVMRHLDAQGLMASAISNPGAVERETTAYLRGRGHVRARVTAGAPVFADGSAVLPLSVDAGPVFTIRGLLFDGAAMLNEETLREAAALTEGMPYDPAALEAARNRLTALYRLEGFPATTVSARGAIDPNNPVVDLTFEIDEGPRQTLNEIVVAGNRGIDTDVVLRALDLSEGGPLRAEDVLEARTRVFNTGLFRRIDMTSEASESPRSDAAPMRLRVTVEEWPAVRLRYGFVVAEERPEDSLEGRELAPGFAADVTRRTLFGRAISLGSALELERRDQSGRIFLSAPTMFGFGLQSSMTLEGERRHIGGTSRIDNRRGISLEQRMQPVRPLQVSYGYRFGHSVTDVPPDALIGALPPISLNIASLTGSAAWDTRNDPTDTARGLFASSTLEFAPEVLGSDIRFVRQIQQAYYFRSWRTAVFASAVRLGTAVPLSGQDLLFSQRFFTGGSRTVRGVEEGGLGPRDFFGDPAGGDAMLVLNQEVRVPLYRWVRGVAFIDAGNVFRRPGDISLRDLVGSLGVGLRVVTPFALLRVDYGKTMWGLSPSSSQWTFGIGQAF